MDRQFKETTPAKATHVVIPWEDFINRCVSPEIKVVWVYEVEDGK